MRAISRPRTRPSSRSSSSSNTYFAFLHTISAVVLNLICPAAEAQDRAAPQTLEELIPDSAIDAPESWASGDTSESAATEAQVESQSVDEPVFDAPREDFPPPPMAWPDDQDLPPIDILEPEGEIEIASLAEDLKDPFADTDIERLSAELELAFPSERALFPIRDEFLAQFEAFSTIEMLDSDDDNLALISARAKSDEELLQTLLRTYGYYDALVIRSVGGENRTTDAAPQSQPVVRFAIVPGPRYAYGAIDLGELVLASDGTELRSAFEIFPGELISSFKITEEQADLDRALGETGYPFAEIDAPELLIDHARNEGDLTMLVRPKGKYVFGSVTSSMPELMSGKHLATIARFEPGELYQRSLEMDLRRAITATGLVSSVVITPRERVAPTANQPGTVDLSVEMSQAKLRTIAGAIGYGSEEGFRVEASWEHRNFFPPEGAIKVRGIAGTQEQLGGITFRRNNFGGRDRIVTVDAFARSFDNGVYEANTASLVGTYERVSTLLFQKEVSWSIGMELVATDERDAKVKGGKNPRETYLVAALPGSILLDQTNDLLDPTSGFRAGLRLSPEVSRQSGADVTYLSGQLDASYYQPVTERVVLAARTRLGSIVGTKVFNIAPSRRLYAGGGGSVRGYGYQQIGPRNGVGEPNGGRSLVELSAEARIRTRFFDGALGIVPFIDAGSVSRSSSPRLEQIKFGAGIGLRYHTGFGPIRLDLGVPLNPGPDDSAFAVYVSLGQAF